jgi:hypothetical protein
VTDADGGQLAVLRADGSTLPEGPAEAAVAGGPGMIRLTAGPGGHARVLRMVFSSSSRGS